MLELSKSDNKFPINLDEVWPLVYSEKSKAVRALRKNFFEGEDFVSQKADNQGFAQNGKAHDYSSVDYFLSLSCLEYFIARKVRPVFEVYRQVFHKAATTMALPTTYKEALQQLLLQVEENEQLQLQNQQQQERITLMLPKVRTYEQVINTPEDQWLKTTTSVANEIGMSAQKLNRMLVATGIIYRAPSGEYLFTANYLNWNLGKTVSVVVDEEKGRISTYIKWNTRGRAYIHALHDTNWDKRRAWHLLKEGKEVVAL